MRHIDILRVALAFDLLRGFGAARIAGRCIVAKAHKFSVANLAQGRRLQVVRLSGFGGQCRGLCLASCRKR